MYIRVVPAMKVIAVVVVTSGACLTFWRHCWDVVVVAVEQTIYSIHNFIVGRGDRYMRVSSN